MNVITDFINNLKTTLPTISVMDIVDILLVALLFYYLITLIRSTSASRIAKAILLVVALTLLTGVIGLHTLNFLFGKVLELGFVALVIVFQPELRRLLEQVGSRSSIKEIVKKPTQDEGIETVIKQTVDACMIMGEERVGALIVFERKNSLEQIVKTGTRVDAEVSQELIRNIFFPKASLHDGAMLIKSGRIEAAGCVLPLSENRQLSSDLGTRHRAGVGMSEQSDAVVLIVSEETGVVSVAIGGMLKRELEADTLERILRRELAVDEEAKQGLLKRIRFGKKEGEDDHAKT